MASYWTKRRKIKRDIEQSFQFISSISENVLESSEIEQSVLGEAESLNDISSKRAKFDQNFYCTSSTNESNADFDATDSSACFQNGDCTISTDATLIFNNSDIPNLHNDVTDSFSSANFIQNSTLLDAEDEFSCDEVFSNSSQMLNEQIVEDISKQLAVWKTGNPSVSHSALSSLLCILQPYFPALPKDARTLLKTPSSSLIVNDIQSVSGGSYFHFGIENEIKKILDRSNFSTTPFTDIVLQCNSDGLPIFKSATDQFWPILGMIISPFKSTPFIIGLFHGKHKPNNLDYINQFVREYIQLQETNGFFYRNTTVHVLIAAFVCDAPARAMLKNVKLHSGYFGCERCTQKGVWCGKMTFPEMNSALRTDDTFKQMCDKSHHRGPTPLTDAGINCVSDMVLDYMHLVCLGVVRRLIMLWIWGPLKCRQSHSMVFGISDHLAQFANLTPAEFVRKPRSLLEVKRWKATEFRQFLLYTGPVVLLGKLPMPLYKNFMLLSVAIRILLLDTMCKRASSKCCPTFFQDLRL